MGVSLAQRHINAVRHNVTRQSVAFEIIKTALAFRVDEWIDG